MKNSENCFSCSSSRLFVLLIIGCIFTSCKTGETIADQGIIQKRKYQKGYYVNVKTPFESKKETVNLVGVSDRPFTASVKAAINSNSKEAKLEVPKTGSPDLTLADRKTTRKSGFVQQSVELEGSMEASISSTPDLKAKSTFQNYLSINNSVKQSNTFSADPDYYAPKRLSTLALLSFIFGVLSIFILGLPFGVAAVVLGILGIVQIEKNPSMYKGKGFAIIGLIIGIIAVVVMLIYLSSL